MSTEKCFAKGKTYGDFWKSILDAVIFANKLN